MSSQRLGSAELVVHEHLVRGQRRRVRVLLSRAKGADREDVGARSVSAGPKVVGDELARGGGVANVFAKEVREDDGA